MKVYREGVNLSVTTRANSMPTEKPAIGRFLMSAEWDTASFVEEEDATVIIGERNTKRLYRGKNCSVMWDKKNQRYKISLLIAPDFLALAKSEWDYEECANYIRKQLMKE